MLLLTLVNERWSNPLDVHLYILFGALVLVFWTCARSPLLATLCSILAPVATGAFLLQQVFFRGHAVAGVTDLFLLYAHGFTCAGGYFTTFRRAGDQESAPAARLAGLALGFAVAGALLWLAYFAWDMAYLLMATYFLIPLGIMGPAREAPTPNPRPALQPVPGASRYSPVPGGEKQPLASLAGVVLVGGILILLAMLAYGVFARHANAGSYWTPLRDVYPYYFLNGYGFPLACFVAAGVLSGVAAWRGTRTKEKNTDRDIIEVLLSYGVPGAIFQATAALVAYGSPGANWVLAVLVGCVLASSLGSVGAILDHAGPREVRGGEITRIMLALVVLVALPFGLILPSQKSAIQQLADVIYVIVPVGVLVAGLLLAWLEGRKTARGRGN